VMLTKKSLIDIFLAALINSEMDIARICNSLEHKTPILRLKRHLFCDYDRITRPNDFKTVTNVTLQLIPKLMDFVSFIIKKKYIYIYILHDYKVKQCHTMLIFTFNLSVLLLKYNRR